MKKLYIYIAILIASLVIIFISIVSTQLCYIFLSYITDGSKTFYKNPTSNISCEKIIRENYLAVKCNFPVNQEYINATYYPNFKYCTFIDENSYKGNFFNYCSNTLNYNQLYEQYKLDYERDNFYLKEQNYLWEVARLILVIVVMLLIILWLLDFFCY